MRSWILSAAAIVAVVFLAGCDDAAQTTVAPPDPAVIARGKALFTGTCGAYCHKMTDTGGDALFLFDCDWKHGAADDDIFKVINEGVAGSRMVAFGGAFPEGDKDARALIAYLRAASQCKK